MNTPESQFKKPGTLYLVPAPLDFGCDSQAPLENVMPHGTLEVAASLSHWVCENAKSTRAYLKRIHATHPLCVPLQAMQLQELPHAVHKKGDHQGQFDARPLLQAALQGEHIGLVSEADRPNSTPAAAPYKAAFTDGPPRLAKVSIAPDTMATRTITNSQS